MNQFKMSLFLPPISPVKDSTTGRIIQPPTLTPYKEITLQEVYKLITSSERLKTLTETVRRAVENGDEKVYRMLKQQINDHKILSYGKVVNWVYIYFIFNNLLFYFSQQK